MNTTYLGIFFIRVRSRIKYGQRRSRIVREQCEDETEKRRGACRRANARRWRMIQEGTITKSVKDVARNI